MASNPLEWIITVADKVEADALAAELQRLKKGQP